VHKHTHKVLQLFHFVYAKVSRILPSAASGHKSLSNLLDLLLVVGGGPNIPSFAQGANKNVLMQSEHFTSLHLVRWFLDGSDYGSLTWNTVQERRPHVGQDAMNPHPHPWFPFRQRRFEFFRFSPTRII